MAVYVIGHRPAASKIKIGSALDPEARLRSLCLPNDKTAIPADVDRATLEILCRFNDGDWAMEHWLHGEFKKARAEGEWFRLGTSADEVVRRVSNAVGRFRDGRRRFQVEQEKPLAGKRAKPDLASPAVLPTELEVRANERELLADLLESRYQQAPNADQREALRAILEIYRPETWRSGGG